MENVPFHTEVRKFCQSISERLGSEYELACEHVHSCCILIAKKEFYIDGHWNTWIDYDRFHKLIESKQPFTSADYIAPTPEWAIFGADEQGFNPVETRVYRNAKYKSSDSGCG